MTRGRPRCACRLAAGTLLALVALLPVRVVSAAIEASAAPVAAVRAHLATGRYADAEQAARAILLVEPEAGEVWRLLGDALVARGRLTLALQAYSQALEDLPSQALAIMVAMAGIHWHAGRDEEANALWNQVMATWRTGSIDDAHELLAVADAARALGHGDPAFKRIALRICEEAIDRAPQDPLPYLALGDLLLSSYNDAEAAPLFAKALSLAPHDPRAVLALARSLHFEHQAEAADAARRAVMLAPNRTAARIFLARVLIDQDDPQTAEVELEAALAINPREVEALSLLAALRDHVGDEEAAQQLMTLVLSIAPRYGEGFAILAELAADRRRYRDAVRYGTRAIALDERNWRAHALVGMNQLRLGHNGAARKALEAAFRGDPFNIWTKNTLDLLDAMDGYAVLERGRFVLTGVASQVEVLAPYLFAIAEQAYDAHSARYGVRPATPIRIEVHPQHEDLSVRTLGTTDVDLLGVSFGPTLVIEGPMVNPGGPFNWASVLWHELAHSFQLELSGGRAPRWLAEGMAVYDEHNAGRAGWGQDVGPGFLQAYLQGRLAKASRLNDRFLNPQAPDDVGNAYLQAGLLVAMIDRQHGSGSLPALLHGFGQGRTTAQLLDEVLGVSASEFDSAFEDYLREQFGAALRALRAPDASDEEGAQSDASHYAGLLRRATQALQDNDLDAAESALLDARALVPGHTGENGPHQQLIALYRRKGDRAGAVASAHALLAIDADALDPLLALADDLQTMGDRAGAIDALQRALLIAPFDIAMHERLAALLEAANAWQRAGIERAAVVALGPADPVGAQYRLALAAHRAGDPQQARRALLAALENAPLFEDGLTLLLTVREQLATSHSPADRDRGGDAAQGRQQ